MTRNTPVATPIAAQPAGGAQHGAPQRRAALRVPVVVISPLGDFELAQGSLLIGRLPECDLLLNDGLVSRMHARISVQGENVVLEDLHSTNGVFVNGSKVGYSAILCEGDRILIGTSELSLFQCRDSTARPVPLFPSAEEYDSEPPGGSPGKPLGALDLRATRAAGAYPGASDALDPASTNAEETEASSADEPIPSTGRVSALEMLGGVAERLAALGNVEEAADLLSGQLKRILKGANSGLPVPPEMVDSASVYALKLARWTNQTLWADYVVELHLSAKRLMSIATLQAYEVAIAKLDFDRLLLAYYVESLAGQLAPMSAAERIRVTHLASILREQS